MLKRTISGAFYVALIVAFFLLRNIHVAFFQIFLGLFCFVGTFEVARAEKHLLLKGIYTLSLISSFLSLPLYCFLKYILDSSYALLIVWNLQILIALFVIIYLCVKKVEQKEKLFANLLTVLYPTLSILFMSMLNDLSGDRGFLGLLLLFVISPCSDTMAYLVGMTYSKIRKGNAKKLCPKLSPKKTVAGSIGGLIGGMLSGLIVYFIFIEKVATLGWNLPLLWFIVIGFVGSILTQIGDLFESLVKRKVGIKDMGNIMPGHGGVMDRIDGMLFLVFLPALVFAIF